MNRALEIVTWIFEASLAFSFDAGETLKRHQSFGEGRPSHDGDGHDRMKLWLWSQQSPFDLISSVLVAASRFDVQTCQPSLDWSIDRRKGIFFHIIQRRGLYDDLPPRFWFSVQCANVSGRFEW